MNLTQKEVLFQVALWSVDGIGRITFRNILETLQHKKISLEEWWQRPQIIKLRSNQVQALQDFQLKFTPQSYLEYLAARNIVPLHESDPRFPSNLAILDDRPPVLFVQGKVECNERSLAVVGTRKVTSYGRLVTEKLVTELVAYDATIISGFMYGVDALAHQTAQSQKGNTIAVLGFGFDFQYPAQFSRWRQELLNQGQTIITDYAPWVQPSKGTFPARNRLIAGLSQGVLVTEAAGKSGSHITAEWAVEYGRSVYAVPGPITNPYTEGTKALINEGALCVQSAKEIAEDLGWNQVRSISNGKSNLSPLAQALYTELSLNSQALGTLLAKFKLPTASLITELSYLELAGLVVKNHQGWAVRKSL